MHFILLTHSRELTKKSATGPLIKQILPNQCDIIEWSRTSADDRLTLTLNKERTLLIYPEAKMDSQKVQDTTNLSQFDTFIILDGTWQEARKIYNRSPYLHALKHYALNVDSPSRYKLRRNQKSIGLCTAEVAIELLIQKQYSSDAKALDIAFTNFNQGLEPSSERKIDTDYL